ncbi:MAG: hypothetical protein CL534_26090 [Ahrensia sp.]|nr:hypothetical protein [Ahrensia sp.]
MSLFEENRRVLENLAENGIDLSIIRPVDFSCIFPNQSAAESFARAAEKEGFSTTINVTENEDNPWVVTASRAMTPTCENITSAELRLASFANSHAGSSDGWGFFKADR